LILIVALLCPFVYGKTIYVDHEAAEAGNGSSWADAYICLQNALSDAQSGDEIRVAEGIYKPDRQALMRRSGSAPIEASGERTATFQLKNGVTIKGGYAGSGQPNPDARDIKLLDTFLSGDLNGDDGPDFTNNSENSYHVVTGNGTDQTAVLEGFIVVNGNADGLEPYHAGGGIYNQSGSPTLISCTFDTNWGGRGGAMANEGQSSPTLTDCTFRGNSADGSGGGIYNILSSPTLTDCLLTDNSAGEKGGAIYNDRSNLTLLGCVFSENTSVSNGAALKLVSSDATITGCRFLGNMTLGGGSANAGAIGNSSSNPTINDCTFVNNSCAGYSGGAIVNYDGSDPTVINCVFQGNSAGAGGGGIFNWLSSSPLVVNCIFAGNSANRGGGMSNNNDCHPTVINCTFVGNRARDTGGGMWSRTGSSPELSNCILWENTGNNGMNMDESAQIGSDGTGTAAVNHCDIMGLTRALGGTGNLGDDPFFVDAHGPDGVIGTDDDDLRLLPGSPCVDAGDNSAIPPSVVMDLDGSPRIANGTVDMGVYELTLAPNVYYVDAINGNDNNDGFTPQAALATIQNGINAAADGEVVMVYPGLYEEEVNFLGKALTVQGVAAGGAGVPVLRNPGDFAVSFYSGEGADSILKNFIIRDSFMGVFIAGSSPAISNLTIVSNKYGIDAYAGSEPDISNIILWNNTQSDLFGCVARYSCVERPDEGNLAVDPLFVDPGNGDHHLRSERGRYWPEHDVWVLDEVTSPCIDAGDPNAEVLDEPMPNRGRINIGAYGGTPQASLSPEQLSRLPCPASYPSPADGSVGVATDVILSWTACSNTVSNDIYFGFSGEMYAGIDIDALLSFVGNQTTTQFDPGMLLEGTVYFWRVDEINSTGKTTGEVWTFTTTTSGLPAPPPKGRACFTGDTGVWLDGVLVPISTVGTGEPLRPGIAREPTDSPLILPCPGKVENVQEHTGTFVCYDVLLESGNSISVAECHYFMAESGRWVAVQDLKARMRLRTSQGSIGIRSLNRRPKPYVGRVYNLRIKGSDWYLVGEDSLVVRDY
jgi:hypothetical protein